MAWLYMGREKERVEGVACREGRVTPPRGVYFQDDDDV
jgi:hypothetical protein